jgi:hypothetical protein
MLFSPTFSFKNFPTWSKYSGMGERLSPFFGEGGRKYSATQSNRNFLRSRVQLGGSSQDGQGRAEHLALNIVL